MESVIDIADSKIRLVSGYRKKIASPMDTAMQYSSELVSSIPGPIRLDPSRYAQDPILRAVFISQKQLEDFLTLTLRNTEFDLPDNGEFTALLTMSRKTKTIYSHQRHGEMTLRDVAMESVTFYDHLIVAPTPSMEQTIAKLKDRVLEVLALEAMEKINTLREELSLLREERAHLRSMRSILRGKNKALGHFAPPSHTTRKKIAAVDKAIIEKEQAIKAVKHKIGEPEDSLHQLAAILSHPRSILEVRELTLDLDWMNVINDKQRGSDSQTISLAEFSLGTEMQRQGILVSFQAAQ